VGTLVSVVMPSYGDADVVARSLPRLLASSQCELEVVVVNNDTEQTGRIRELVDGLRDTRVRALELEHAAGYCKAINAGISATAGELVFFANSDLFVADGYVDTIARFFVDHARAACATGKILRYNLANDLETDVIDTTGLVIGRNRRVVDRGENQTDTGQYEREEQVFGVSGAALVARREALKSVNVRGKYLDESFHMYKEDVDLSWRFRLLGWECWYVPRAVAYHARTSHGLADTEYLAAPRAFHASQRAKPGYVRSHSMKNQWLLLVKNDDASNLVRDLPWIVGREALVLAHGAVFAPRDTASAVRGFIGALPSAITSKRKTKARRCTSPAEVRQWLVR
jgi:GT2 family glycosyltransferase